MKKEKFLNYVLIGLAALVLVGSMLACDSTVKPTPTPAPAAPEPTAEVLVQPTVQPTAEEIARKFVETSVWQNQCVINWNWWDEIQQVEISVNGEIHETIGHLDCCYPLDTGGVDVCDHQWVTAPSVPSMVTVKIKVLVNATWCGPFLLTDVSTEYFH